MLSNAAKKGDRNTARGMARHTDFKRVHLIGKRGKGRWKKFADTTADSGDNRRRYI
jgi:hypothetical protein